jgi:hypothetical protein
MVYSRAERVFILENYITSKLFATVSETICSAYFGEEVPNKATAHRPVTKFVDTGTASAHRATTLLMLRLYRFQAVHKLQQRDTTARF